MSYVAIADDSVRWVRQLTGEWQRSPDGSRIPTLSTTRSKYGIDGTDLGSSFFDGERLWFLFGDTWPDGHLDDSFAWTTDTDPEAGLTLKFLGGDRNWKRPTIFQGPQQLSTGPFEVPTGGFALGGRRYVIFTGRHYEKYVDGEKRQVMGSSALCRQRDGGVDLADLQVVFELSDETAGGRFINASPLVVPQPPPGLPFGGPAVLVWGSGTYRHSHCYLAVVSAALPAPPQGRPVEDRSRWRYLGRIRDDGTPDWISEQHQAMSLFAPPDLGGDGGIGELSVAWIEPLRVWMLAYGYHRAPNEFDRMVFRTAPRPWGPWSEPQLLDNATNPAMAHGTMMHTSWDVGGVEGTDQLYDRGRGTEWGAPYAPYLIDHFTRPAGPNRAQIWFTLSSWNPYQAHLMTAVLERRPGDVVVHPDAPFVLPGGPGGPEGGALPPGGGGDHLEPGIPPGAGLLGGGHGRIKLDPPKLPRGAGHDRIDQDPPLLPLPTGGLSMIRSRFGPAGNNFELITPMLSGGLSFVAAQNDPWPPAWGPAAPVGRVNVTSSAASIALAVTPDHPDAPEDQRAKRDRLVVAASTGDRVVYFFREPRPGPRQSRFHALRRRSIGLLMSRP